MINILEWQGIIEINGEAEIRKGSKLAEGDRYTVAGTTHRGKK